jgi:hypothetical protein
MMGRHHRANPILTEYVFIFAYSLLRQLEGDYETYGDEWRRRTREGQEERIYERLESYWIAYNRSGQPIPWLKVAGLALIAWLRENYPMTLIAAYVDPD